MILMASISYHGCPLGGSFPCTSSQFRLAINHAHGRFMIGGMATILPFGRLYTIYDAKWIYITSFVLFLAGSALCGGAPTMDAEIIGRVLAGAGGNGMYVGLQALMSMHTTDKERPTYLSYV